jgi:hypothetical protein
MFFCSMLSQSSCPPSRVIPKWETLYFLIWISTVRELGSRIPTVENVDLFEINAKFFSAHM